MNDVCAGGRRFANETRPECRSAARGAPGKSESEREIIIINISSPVH